MARLCAGHVWYEVADEMRRLWGLEITQAKVQNFRNSRGIACDRSCRRYFPKGNVPANKGRTWDEWMSPEGAEASRRTQFKPGCLSGAAKGKLRPIGAEIIHEENGASYCHVKVSDEGPRRGKTGSANYMGRWQLRSRVVWEEANGSIPKGSVIVHVDGDSLNDDITNLACVTRSQLARLAKGPRWWNRESFEACLAMADLRAEAARARRAA